MATDEEFLNLVADSLIRLPGAVGVALGGSRAQGTSRPDSDWDFSIYYRGSFDPEHVRALGWQGQTTDLGGWGPLFNGGGAFTVDGRPIDIHYRDLDRIDAIQSDAERGEFTVEALLFHQAGIPSYILLAELAMNRTLRGELPRPAYPDALRRSAPAYWWPGTDLTLHYAKAGHARHGRVAQCAGLIGVAGCRAGHAILAHRGEWVTNEKQLLTRAGLRSLDDVVADLTTDAEALEAQVDRARGIIESALTREGIDLDWGD
jgi:predicted nucleotidyltransferase